MRVLLTWLILFFINFVSAQVPEDPFNPMTAPGANGISTTQHILYWQNPPDINFNEIYFSDDSMLVANNDTSVRVKTGYPSTVYSSYSLSESGPLSENTKYFWKVVETVGTSSSESPLWYFTTFTFPNFNYTYDFNSGLNGWQFFGPLGQLNWSWLNSVQTGGTPGELVFRWDPVFIGDSYFISPNMTVVGGATVLLHFKYYEDWWADTVVVGCAVTSDYGSNWNSVWELVATSNSGPADVYTQFEVQDSFRLGFYYTGNSDNIDFLFLNDVSLIPEFPLTPPVPPQMLGVFESNSEQKVSVEWTPGWAPSGVTGYELQRKDGTPDSNSVYITIATTDQNTFNYDDTGIELNKSYTYRIRTLVMGFNSQFGNEATAYVPLAIPVELTSFTGTVSGNSITLKWTTSTEINNSGFEIERKIFDTNLWEKVGFVEGSGTTTEIHSYSFPDKNLGAGKYNYRLKQIDYDGTFEYSNPIEIEIGLPSEYLLKQNYPNPFNPNSIISFDLPEDGFVNLTIYDILGNEVAEMVNEFRPAGRYKVEFTGTELTSGIYLYKLKAGKFSETKKMMLIK